MIRQMLPVGVVMDTVLSAASVRQLTTLKQVTQASLKKDVVSGKGRVL